MPIVFYSLLLLTLVGCSSGNLERAAAVGDYRPSNIYSERLPKTFTRVALLPMGAQSDFGVKASLEGIERSIASELVKTKRFEVVDISSDQLREICGKSTLSSLDPWPTALREALSKRQIDGVVLVEMTSFHGYEPVGLGLKARLVGLETGKTYWAADEVFDARNASVYAAARAYEKGMVPGVNKDEDSTIARSPSRFASYAAYSLFRTLPR